MHKHKNIVVILFQVNIDIAIYYYSTCYYFAMESHSYNSSMRQVTLRTNVPCYNAATCSISYKGTL